MEVLRRRRYLRGLGRRLRGWRRPEKCYLASESSGQRGCPLAIRDHTVKERILLHLFDYTRHRDAYEVPEEMTQSGLARAAGIRVQHATQYLRPLVEEGLVEEDTRHIQGRPRRRKVYFLTVPGRQKVAALRNGLLQEEVPLRTADGNLEHLPLAHVYQEKRRGSSLVTLLKELRQDGFVRELAPGAVPAGFVDQSAGAPSVERFYGRKQELAEILKLVEKTPLVVVTGMAGIGKSALASRVCDALRDSRSLFWHRVRPWDGLTDLAGRVAAFLAAHGRMGLYGHLSSRDRVELGPLEGRLAADLEGLRALLLFDDVQNASGEARSLFPMLLEVLKSLSGATALLFSRSPPDFYSRREVTMDRSVAELSLRGLDQSDSQSLLADAGLPEETIPALAKAVKGNPLFLKLLAQGGSQSPLARGWRDLSAYIAEEIEPALSASERHCLESASLIEGAAPPEALLLEGGGGAGVVVGLQRKGLLDEVIAGDFLIHDLLREHFRQGLSAERRETLAARLVPWLQQQAEGRLQEGEPTTTIAALENAVRVDPDPERRISSLRQLGDVRTLIGDHPGARHAYQEALGLAKPAGLQAFLHALIASTLHSQYRLEEAERAIETGLRLLPKETTLEGAWLTFWKAQIAVAREEWDRGMTLLEEVRGQMDTLPEDLGLQGLVEDATGIIHIFDPRHIDLVRAQEAFRRAIQAYEAIGDLRVGEPYKHLAMASFELGEVEEGVENIRRAVAVNRRKGNLPVQMQALTTEAHYRSVCLGEHETAETLLQEAQRIAGETHQPFRVLWFHRLFADVYWRQGRLEEARETFGYFLQVGRESLPPEIRAENLARMARLCVASQDLEAAQGLIETAQGLSGSRSPDAVSYHLAWAEGVLAAARGDLPRARHHFETGDRLGAPPHQGELLQQYLASGEPHAELLLDCVPVLQALGDSAAAAEMLSRAAKEVDRLRRAPLQAAITNLGS